MHSLKIESNNSSEHWFDVCLLLRLRSTLYNIIHRLLKFSLKPDQLKHIPIWWLISLENVRHNEEKIFITVTHFNEFQNHTKTSWSLKFIVFRLFRWNSSVFFIFCIFSVFFLILWSGKVHSAINDKKKAWIPIYQCKQKRRKILQEIFPFYPANINFFILFTQNIPMHLGIRSRFHFSSQTS